MDDGAQEPDNGWKIGLAAFGLFVFIGTVSGLPPKVAMRVVGAVGLLLALGSILIFIRWLNHRTDPRRAKPPSDPP